MPLHTILYEYMGVERFAIDWSQRRDRILRLHELMTRNQRRAYEIGASPLDWIEALTPAPDTDMTLAAARVAWPGKIQFINFPSSVHLETDERIRQTTMELLLEAAPGDRFIVGITENVPENRRLDQYQYRRR